MAQHQAGRDAGPRLRQRSTARCLRGPLAPSERTAEEGPSAVIQGEGGQSDRKYGVGVLEAGDGHFAGAAAGGGGEPCREGTAVGQAFMGGGSGEESVGVMRASSSRGLESGERMEEYMARREDAVLMFATGVIGCGDAISARWKLQRLDCSTTADDAIRGAKGEG